MELRWPTDRIDYVPITQRQPLHLPESCKDTLAAMHPFAIAGRYPDSPFPLPTHDEARGYAERVQEVFTCLMRLLSQ